MSIEERIMNGHPEMNGTRSQVPNLQAEVQAFGNNVKHELDKIIVGEPTAKRVLAANMILGGNAGLLGGTGSAKTELLNAVPHLFHDMSEEEAVFLDTKDDLLPKELTGVYVPRFNEKTGEFEQKFVPGMIGKGVVYLAANEINRTSPSGLNTMLEIFEKRTMEVSGRRVNLDKLQFSVATFNPGENKQNVHTLSQANASRFQLGALMGEDPASNKLRSEAIHLDNFDERAENPSPIVHVADLEDMRQYTRKQIAYPKATGQHAISLVEKAGEVLSGGDRPLMNERGGRLDVHVKRTAKVLAALDGSAETTPEHIDEAMRHIVTVRVGMLATRGGIKQVIDTQEQLGIAA